MSPSAAGVNQDPEGQIPPFDPFGGGVSVNQDGSGGGLLGQTVTRGCRPPITSPEFFAFLGVEIALIALMLIGILAVLFGNPETDVKVAKVAAMVA